MGKCGEMHTGFTGQEVWGRKKHGFGDGGVIKRGITDTGSDEVK